MRGRTLVCAVIALAVSSCCGKEAGRVPFAGEGASDITMNLTAGEVAFWTDIDIEYKGDAALQYDVELVQSGSTVATVACDPLAELNVKMSWVETNLGDEHTRRGSGKMHCTATLASGGSTTVRAKLAFSRRPTSVRLTKADLVVKQ
jgi:hypothetical protein